MIPVIEVVSDLSANLKTVKQQIHEIRRKLEETDDGLDDSLDSDFSDIDELWAIIFSELTALP